jgi:CIC family chloride channel protein
VHASDSAAVLPAYIALGGVMALAAVVFIRGLYATEDFFDRVIPRSDYARHVIGMLGVGVTLAVLMSTRGHYYVEGVGYATIVDVLTGGIGSASFLVLLFVLKLMTTSLTLGSGGSGGVFSPSLFMGATLGGAFGIVLHRLFPAIPFDPAALALAGMAGLIAGATGAALTAIVMIFEMTLDYSVVLPMTLTVAVAHGVRRALLAQNIYTMKLVRRGHYMSEALQANAHLVHHVGDLVMATVAVVSADATRKDVLDAEAYGAPEYFVLVEAGEVVGIVGRDTAHSDAVDAAPLAHLARSDFVVVDGDTTLFDLVATMHRRRAGVAVVRANAAAGARIVVAGIVTGTAVAEAIAEGMEMFSD